VAPPAMALTSNGSVIAESDNGRLQRSLLHGESLDAGEELGPCEETREYR
jgi:hypothetical protein